MSSILHLPRPSLLNPSIFEDTVFSDLSSVLGLATGEVLLKYERTGKYPLTMGASNDAGHLNGMVHRFEEFRCTIEHYCDPLKVTAFGAAVKPLPQTQCYRVMPAAVGCRELFTRAHLHSELFGSELQLKCNLKYSTIGSEDLSCSFEADMQGHKVFNRRQISALEVYRGDAAQIWVEIVETALGPWAIANGVKWISFEASFPVDSDIAHRLAEEHRLECERNGLWIE